MAIKKLFVEINANTQGLQDGLKKAQSGVASFGTQIKKSNLQLQSTGGIFNGVANKAAGLGKAFSSGGVLGTIDKAQKGFTKLKDGVVGFGAKVNSAVKESNGSLTGMIGALTGVSAGWVAIAAAAAAANVAVAAFAFTSTQAFWSLESAQKAFESTLTARGYDTDKAKSFIESYTKDALIAKQEAMTAYKLLASRGYEQSQITDILSRLKDSAVNDRQGSLSLGEAVRSAAEGLKNENSILVDNAGVTKNVSKMWETYAKIIGTTTDKLTDAQKRQAEYNGIMQETAYQVGNAAAYATTGAGQFEQLKLAWEEFKVAFGETLAPELGALVHDATEFLKIIKEWVKPIKIIAGILFPLFGSTLLAGAYSKWLNEDLSTANELSKTSTKNKKLETDATNSLAAAEKKRMGSLASFDKLNILTQKTSTDAAPSSASDKNSPAGSLGLSGAVVDDEPEKKLTRMQLIIASIRKAWENLTKGWNEFWDGIGKVFSEIGKNFAIAWEDFKYLASKAWDAVSNAAAKVWTKIKEGFSNFGKWIGEKWTSIKDSATAAWDAVKSKASDFWDWLKVAPKSAFNGIVGWIEALINRLLSGINVVSDALSKLSVTFPDWFPGGLAGKKFGINIPKVEPIKLPRLASGGIAYGDSIVEVGEYPRAHINPEVIAPLDKLKGILLSAVRGSNGGDINLRTTLVLDDGTVLYRVNQRKRRSGSSQDLRLAGD
jgi:hypothetical protein